MKHEIETLELRNTWEKVYPPKGANVIGTRFVYKIKKLANGKIDKYKARLVVQGFAQIDGIDFYSDDTFAPVARLTTVRLMLAWAAIMDYEIHQIDIKSAYLYGELNENEVIYVKPPPGNYVNIKKGQVLKLKKALYGLKQAGRRWYKTFIEILRKIGFKRAYYDNVLFFRKEKNVVLAILFIHVDDVTIIAKNMFIIKGIKEGIRKYVDFTDGNELNWLLGIEIERNRKERIIKLRQKAHIERILERFNLQDEKERTTPITPGLVLRTNTIIENKKLPYMNMVGALRYAADCTRPDISFTTSLLARFLQNPSNEHYNTVKHCFGYLKRTKDYWLTLGGDSDVHFVYGFSDTDSMNQEEYKAISGYVF